MTLLVPLMVTLATSPINGTPIQTIKHCLEHEDCTSYIVVEAENFTVTESGWRAQAWAHDPNLFSSDVSNVFMNRRAYLHADANATSTASAEAEVEVPETGKYTVLVRYEAPYRFSCPYNITIRQQNQIVFQQTYGKRSSPRVWGFSGCTDKYNGLASLSSECRWNYGSTENMVWEGPSLSGNYTTQLTAGQANITITVTGADGEIAERNIDTIVLTQNESDIEMRLNSRSEPLQLDGLIATQAGEVFAQVISQEALPMNITLPRTADKSPLDEHKLILPVLAPVRNDPGSYEVEAGCGFRTGAVQVAPDPLECPRCGAQFSSQYNCTAEEIASACASSSPYPHPSSRCIECTESKATNLNCTLSEREIACTRNVTKLGIRCTIESISERKNPCPSKCTPKVLEEIHRKCYVRPPTSKNSPASSRCVNVELKPHGNSGWIDVGAMIDSMNHAPWNLPAGNYSLSFGTKLADGTIAEIANFSSNNKPLQILTDASIRSSHRIRPRAADFWELYQKLSDLEPTLVGKPPTNVPIFANTFSRNSPGGGSGPLNGTGVYDPKYAKAELAFEAMFPISAINNPIGGWKTEWGYLDLRGYVNNPEYESDTSGKPSQTLREVLQSYIDQGLADYIRAIKLGDEISLARPSGNGTDIDSGFHKWLQEMGRTPADLGCIDYDSCHYNVSIETASSRPALFYYSSLYSNDYGIDSSYRNATMVISEMLPQALAGANYAPIACRVPNASCMSYLPETFKWIRAFRAGTFTLPFTEDYIWQQPPGTQQMYTLVVDVERAAIRQTNAGSTPAAFMNSSQLIGGWPKAWRAPSDVAIAPLRSLPSSLTKPGRPLMQYVMAHYPGNTPKSWRRQFYGDLAHGVKYIHLYSFAPSTSSPSNDFVDADGGMYEAILRATHELGQWDDILAASEAHAAGVKVALLFSETGDIFMDTYGTAGSAKRALYIALVHSQYAIDVVTEEDLVSGALQNYAVLYIAHRHITDTAAKAVAAWTRAGGIMVSLVCGGLRNQANTTNFPIADILRLNSSFGIYSGSRKGVEARIDYIKQDIAFAEVLDEVNVHSPTAAKLTVVGEKVVFTPPSDSTVLASFASDGSVAAYSRVVGSGRAYFFGFHPGLSYFWPAVPKRPVDRGSTDNNFNHWVPTAFDAHARMLAALPAASVVGAAPVISSEPRVDIGVLSASGKGTVLPVTNWAGTPFTGINITLMFSCTFQKASLASGARINTFRTSNGNTGFIFDLDVADAVILR